MNMKQFLTALVFVGGLAAAQANAACNYPSDPGRMPDGNTATKEEMQAAFKLIKQYNADMKTYLECLDTELNEKLASMPNASDKEKADIQKRQNQKHDAAVTRLTEVTDGFNEQLRTFKAKNPSEKKTS
jgi:hypothetical protein